jgi:hypothetical protein
MGVQAQKQDVTEQVQPLGPRDQLSSQLVGEDVDPFEQSYLSEDAGLLPTSSRLSERVGGGRGVSSAELNRKEPLPYSVDSESERGEGDDESDLPYPGSGFF